MSNVLVTGASKGLGLEICKQFLLEGWHVYCISRTMSDELKNLINLSEEMKNLVGNNLTHKKFDLSSPKDIKKELFKNFITNSIPLHAVVHNAAIAYDDIVTNVRYDKLQQMYDVNVLSPIMINRCAIRNMLFNQVQGSIVSISSISSATGYKGLSMYASTKGALQAHSKNLAREWGPRGIRFNCVVPGFMETNMSDSLSKEQKDRIYNRTCLRKQTSKTSVAKTVTFLCSPSANSITGQDFYVDSGTI